MTNKQFSFSLTVATMLMMLGTVIAEKDAIGMSLLVLGAAIGALALFSKWTGIKRMESESVLLVRSK
jgi:hypothetical protein